MMGDRLLPTTMVGSYPRPSWFTWQLQGRDVLEAFKVIHHAEAFKDAVRTVLKDQERAGLDILADGTCTLSTIMSTMPSPSWVGQEGRKASAVV